MARFETVSSYCSYDSISNILAVITSEGITVPFNLA